jgi:hypothetical protein
MATLSSIAFALLFSAILSVTVVAQSENGSISGAVKDSAGAVVSGAAVSLTRAHAILRTTQTGADGKFILDNVALQVLRFRVRVSWFEILCASFVVSVSLW